MAQGVLLRFVDPKQGLKITFPCSIPVKQLSSLPMDLCQDDLHDLYNFHIFCAERKGNVIVRISSDVLAGSPPLSSTTRR